MTSDVDSLPEFAAIDEDGYAPDRPLSTGLLRRMRKQQNWFRSWPDPCGFDERKNPGGAFPEMYAAVPRTIAYHPRLVPAGTRGVRVTAALAAGPYEASTPGGEARLMVRVSGRTYRSDWQEIDTTPSGEVKPYTFEVEFAARQASWCEVALVTRSYAYSTIETRAIYQAGSIWQGVDASVEDPYGEDIAFRYYDPTASGGEGELVDVTLYHGKTSSTLTGASTGRYSLSPILDSFSTQPFVQAVNLFWLSMPYGYQVDLIQDDDLRLTNYSLRAGVIPRSDRGPGRLQRLASEHLQRPVTSSIGTNYPEKPGASWARYPRWQHHTEADPLTLTHVVTPYNAGVRVRINLAIIGQRTDKWTASGDYAEIFDSIETRTVNVTHTLRHPTDGTVVGVGDTIQVDCFKHDISGVSPFLYERYLADGAATDGWTYRDGQLFVGRSDLSKGDFNLISLQAVELTLPQETFESYSLDALQPLYVDLEFGEFDADGAGTYKLTVIGSSVQQSIL